MARIGFMILPGHGHVLPSLALAKALQSRRHDVVYYGTDRFRGALEREGMPLVVLRIGPRAGWISRLGRYGAILDLFGRMVDLTIQELPERVRRDRLNLLVVDQSVISGRTVAELAGVPFVTFIPGLPLRRDRDGRLPPLFATWPPAATVVSRLRNRAAFGLVDAVALPLVYRVNRRRLAMGLRPHRRLDDSFSEEACITQLPSAFEPDGVQCRRPFHLLGPFVDVAEAESRETESARTFPMDRIQGRSVLYVSFGTAAPVPRGAYRTVLEGSSGLGFTRVVSTGGRSVPDELARCEDRDTIVVRFAPQLAILRRASAVVTHAGLNTVLESLLLGKPMLMMPICDDQPGVASRVARAGAGLVLPASRATAAGVRAALIRLRDAPCYRNRAEALASAIVKGGGAHRGAEVVEQVLWARGDRSGETVSLTAARS